MPGAKGKSGGRREGAGRIAFNPTKEQRELVMMLAAFGLPHSEINGFIKGANGSRISEPTLYKNFREELDTGKSKANVKVALGLYKKAIGGNVTAMIFWLKCQAGWKDSQRLEVTGKDGVPLIPQKLDDMTDEQLAAIAAGGGKTPSGTQKVASIAA